MIQAWCAETPGGRLKEWSYDPGALGLRQVEVAVESCGLCHSDVSCLDNAWGITRFPYVPGHEVVGRITHIGDAVEGLRVGQRVGVGWWAGSCERCERCLTGRHNKCVRGVPTIIGHHGGFADRVRCDALWAIPLPESLDASTAGPLFCGGVTVFAPLLKQGVKPTDRLGIVGLGGLGHLALRFTSAWGCEAVAFTSSPAKAEQARDWGAHRVADSRDPSSLNELRGYLDFILVTVNVPLNWSAYLSLLRPGGKLHFVGAVLEPLQAVPALMLEQDWAITTSDTSGPAELHTMLEFCARHRIAPHVERMPMSDINTAFDRLRNRDVAYRLVLDRDA